MNDNNGGKKNETKSETTLAPFHPLYARYFMRVLCALVQITRTAKRDVRAPHARLREPFCYRSDDTETKKLKSTILTFSIGRTVFR